MTDEERHRLGERLGKAQARYLRAVQRRGSSEAATRERREAREELELCEEMAREALQGESGKAEP